MGIPQPDAGHPADLGAKTNIRACCSPVMFWQSMAMLSRLPVPEFSPSQSVSYLINWASYLLYGHATRTFILLNRDERWILRMAAYYFSAGQEFERRKISNAG